MHRVRFVGGPVDGEVRAVGVLSPLHRVAEWPSPSSRFEELPCDAVVRTHTYRLSPDGRTYERVPAS